MPVVQISLNVALAEQEKHDLLLSIARLVSEIMEKPIRDVMVSLTTADFVMEDSFDPAAFVDLRCLSGLQVEGVTKRLCEGLLDALRRLVPMDSSRVYIHFSEASPEYAWRFLDGVAVCPKSAGGAR
jgi:phenylpyruvate tautomerase PptA (4-oxalocrotonate tautomerase family)